MAWVVQAHVGCPLAGLPIVVTEETPGSLLSPGTGVLIVDIDVVAVRSDKARKGGGRPAASGCGGQNQSGDDGDQDDQDQPGAPPAAKLGAEHQPDCAQDDLLAPVLFIEPATSKVATCSSPVVVAPSPWRGAVTTTHATAYPELSSRTAIPNGHFKEVGRGRSGAAPLLDNMCRTTAATPIDRIVEIGTEGSLDDAVVPSGG